MCSVHAVKVCRTGEDKAMSNIGDQYKHKGPHYVILILNSTHCLHLIIM